MKTSTFNQLPPSMSVEEEREFCERTKLATEEDRQALVAGKLREAVKLVHTIAQSQLSVEEAIPLAFLGLTKAVANFDPSRNVPFMGYAWRSLRGEVFRYFREEKGLGSHLNIEDAQEDESQSPGVPLSLLGTEESKVDHILHIKELYESVLSFVKKSFSPRDVQFFLLRFNENLSFREIGQQFNVSGAFVQTRLDFILRKYRQRHL